LNARKSPGNRHDIDIGARQRGKEFRGMPRRVRIPSPTTEMIARRSMIDSGSSSPLSAPDRTHLPAPVARAQSLCGTQKLMLYSEEDWVISTTEIPLRDMVANTRAAMPTMPFIPGPETLNIAMLLRLEMPFTGRPSSSGWRQSAYPAPAGYRYF
jgi:hypothetical protein